jgi:hypothetical protein
MNTLERGEQRGAAARAGWCGRGFGLVTAGLMTASSVLHGADGRLNFVSCPIVRDTATVPCWLAEYEGELYFLTIQSDVSAPVTPPWLGHRVLVEGTVSKESRICGGVVLNPVRLSVLPERDASCNTMLPAEKRYDLTFEPPRPPGPSQGRLAFAPAVPPAAPRPPAEAAALREFVVQYDFDGLVGFSHPTVLSAALEHAKQVNARSIEIEGHRGAVRLSNGQTMLEAASIGRRRAEQVAMLLRGAGLVAPEYKVSWVDAAARATGTDDHLTRRVIITVRR